MVNDSKLANELLSRGIIDDVTLRRGREYQLKRDQSLFEALSLGKFVDERRLVETAATILDVPGVMLSDRSVSDDVIQLVPSSMAFRNRIFPVEFSGQALVLAMVNPLDVLAMDEVGTRTGVEISPVLVTAAEMDRVLEKYYRGHDELHALDDGILDSISALDVDSMVDDVISEESWVGFFDDQLPADEMSSKMKNRASTGVLELDSEIELEDGIDLLAGLDDVSQDADGEDHLADWEVDDAIFNNNSLGETSFILSKDSAEELFKQETLEPDPDEEIPQVGILKDTARQTLIGSPGEALQPFDALHGDAEERDRNATPINTIAIERSDPETTELSNEQLGDLAMRFADASDSSLEEDTASADERVERISSLMKGFQRRTVSPIDDNSISIPQRLVGFSDRELTIALIQTLVDQGALDFELLIRAIKER